MYTIQNYVMNMMKEKNMSKIMFLSLLGYKNIAKGIRRFDAFIKGDMSIKHIIENIHKGLGIEKCEVDKLLKQTEKDIEKHIAEETEKQRSIEREYFKSYLFVKTDRKIPSPIFAYVMMGIERLRRVSLPENFSLMSEIEKSIVIRQRIDNAVKAHEGTIPTMGLIKYFILHEVYDDCESERKVYDTEGKLVSGEEYYDKSVYIGRASLTVRGQHIEHLFDNLHAARQINAPVKPVIH